MFRDRLPLYQQLETSRNSKVLVYVTGDRRGLETIIHPEVLDFFVGHLDLIQDAPKISLYLYTRGGDTLACWSIVNLIRQFCNEFEVIVPFNCHSGGTLISLGADKIVMTKQATLGPIDPSINTPLNPEIPGAPAQVRYPVSVEEINAFTEFVRKVSNQPKQTNEMLSLLSQKIHPLVLGKAFRTRSQIRMLAKKLLSKQIKNQQRVNKILEFLCNESGSHDYTINRREARDELKLNIEKPDDTLYLLIKSIYDDIASELQLSIPFDPNIVLGQNNNAPYTFKRGLIESVTGGSHHFASEGSLAKISSIPGGMMPGMVPGSMMITDNRTFEGWRHEPV